MEKYYLVKEYTYFVDSHGEVDFGGIVKKIKFTDDYNDLDLSKTYDENLEEVDSDNYYGSEDGYNVQYIELEIEEVTEDRAKEIEKIIKDYENI